MTIKRLNRGSVTRAAQGSLGSLSSALIISLPLLLTLSTGCGDVDSASYQGMEASALDESVGSSAEEQLAQQLPLEINLTASEREEYIQILGGVYEELNSTEELAQAQPEGASDPSASCDRCGRETGFLPIPDLFLTRLIPVEMKALTLGLVSWDIDLESSASMLLDLLGDEAPESLLFSYRLTFARVEIDAMGEDERLRAARGELLEMGESEYVSITQLNTAQEESAVSFEHGFAYVISLVATESSVKLSSAPSAPLMLYCPSADKDDNDEVQGGGCIQLVDQMEGR